MEAKAFQIMGGSLEFEPALSKTFKDDDGKAVTYPNHDRVVFNYNRRDIKIDYESFRALAEVLLKNKDVQAHIGIKGGLF
jgi:hypothetical protein